MPRRAAIARTVLTAAALAAAAVAVPAASSAGQHPARRAVATTPIRHVVVVYLENHSFDNVLGYWCDQNPGRCPDGGMPSSVRLSDGSVVNPSVAPDTVPNVTHSVAAQLAAMNIVSGTPQMNGWQNITGKGGTCAAPGYQCVSGYASSQVPNLTTLAQDFAISDMTFSMMDSPSWGGHLYAVTGSLDGFTGDNPVPAPGVTTGPGWGCDSNRLALWFPPGTSHGHMVPSCVPDYGLPNANGGAFEPTPVQPLPTIFDRLDAAGLPWRIYGSASPGSGPQSGGWGWSICPSVAGCLYTSQRNNLVDQSQFLTDAAAGQLPAFSIITAGGTGLADSCHNAMSMTACDNRIGQLVQAAENGPQWGSTAIFITFDDFGGFYDQVPPGLNPDYTRQGPRVPLIIVSPYAKAGFTDTTATTFAGILAYTEQDFGLVAMGPNDARAYPFSNAFDYSQVPLRPVRMVSRPLPPSARRIRITRATLNDPS